MDVRVQRIPFALELKQFKIRFNNTLLTDLFSKEGTYQFWCVDFSIKLKL